MGTVVGILFVWVFLGGEAQGGGEGFYPSCDLDWAALFFEALGAKRLDFRKILGAGSWIIPGCEVRQICSLSDFLLFFFKLVWFSVRFLGSVFYFEVDYAEHVKDADLFYPHGFLAVLSAFMKFSLSFPFSFHLLPPGSTTMATIKPLVDEVLRLGA